MSQSFAPLEDSDLDSFDGSFDVSHIAPHSGDDAETDEEDEYTRAANLAKKHQQQERERNEANPQQHPIAGLERASADPTLADERARRRISAGQMQSQQTDAPAAAQSQPQPQSQPPPVIPRLALGSLQPASSPQPSPPLHNASTSSIASSISSLHGPPSVYASSLSSARPSTAAAGGSATTRSRLSAFNHKLRAARRIQQCARTYIACKEARREANMRRAERDAMQRAEEAANGSRSRPPTAAAPPDKQRSLAHLKEKLAARSSTGGSTARPATSSPPISPHAMAANHSGQAARPAYAYAARPQTAAPKLMRTHQRMDSDPASFREFPPRSAPALRAFVQGFLVRNIMSQRATVELVAQIRDVRALMLELELEGANGGKFNATLHRGMQSQLVALKQKLASLFDQPQSFGEFAQAPCRVRFERARSPRSEHAALQRLHAADNAALAGAGGDHRASMLKRKSVRRTLKKKEAPELTMPAQRPATAGPAAAASSFEDPAVSAWATNHAEDDSSAPQSSPPPSASASASGASRSFLRRSAKSHVPSRTASKDWSSVRPRIDNKLEGVYNPLSSKSSNAIYESASGREWSDWERREAMVGGGGAVAAKGNGALAGGGSASSSQAKRGPPPPAGSQTSRDPPASRPSFRPSGNAAGVLPLRTNIDSAVPADLSSPPRSGSGSGSATARSAKKSRHIILAAKKHDLSHIKARIDDSSPYKAASAWDQTNSDEESDDRFYAGKRGGSASPPRHKKSGIPVLASRASQSGASSVGSLGPRATAAHAPFPVSLVTPSRAELDRLDAELRREQSELQSEERAWDEHGVGARLHTVHSPFAVDPLPPKPKPRPSTAAAATRRGGGGGGPGPHNDRSIDEEESNRVMRELEAELGDASTKLRAQDRRAAPSGPATSAAASAAAFRSSESESSDLSPSSPSSRPHRVRSSRSRLSAQDSMINDEIAAIESALHSMSSFAAQRGTHAARAEANAQRQQAMQARPHAQAMQQMQQMQRPQTAAPSFESPRGSSSTTSSAAGSASRSFSAASMSDDLPSEWKRVVPADQSAIPLFDPTAAAAPRDRQMRPQTAAPFSPHRSSPSSSAAAGGGVLSLTHEFDQLNRDVAAFMQQR